MLSILIPTYNYNCVQLVHDLAQQAQQLQMQVGDKFQYEIIVGDDASTNTQTVLQNLEINNIAHCRVWRTEKNLGRAKMRNALIAQSSYKYVLLTDSDAAVCTNNFLSAYWKVKHQANVICGTVKNPNTACKRGYELRYKYEHAAETHRLARITNPEEAYYSFTAFNLWMNKAAVGTIKFDEQCKEYGYEDALFGLMLQQQGVSIKHINNPLMHMGIDSNSSFLSKTEAAMRTLSHLKGIMQKHAGTSRLYHTIHQSKLSWLLKYTFLITKPLIRKNLLGRHPSLALFQFYKLGYFATLQSDKNKS